MLLWFILRAKIISITLTREDQHLKILVMIVIGRVGMDLFSKLDIRRVTFNKLLLNDRTDILPIKELVGAKG